MTIKQVHKGFTLIEIMIALVIGVFLTAGASQIFLSTNQSNRMQENLSRMQENARFAMNYLTEDIRRADFWGGQCAEGILGSINNHIDTSDPQYDPAKHQFDLTTTDNAVTGTDGGINANRALDPADTITVKGFFGNGGAIHITQAMPTTSADLKVTQNSGLSRYDIVLVSDCNVGDIFEITHINVSGGNDNLVHNTGNVGAGNGPGNATKPLQKSYNTNAQIYNLSDGISRKYSIDATTGALQRGSDDLVDNIENMQIVYGVKSGNTIYYAPYSGAMNMDNVISVRVSLLVRSPDDNLTATPKAYFYNDASTTPADRRLRKVYTSTITIRNRLP